MFGYTTWLILCIPVGFIVGIANAFTCISSWALVVPYAKYGAQLNTWESLFFGIVIDFCNSTVSTATYYKNNQIQYVFGFIFGIFCFSGIITGCFFSVAFYDSVDDIVVSAWVTCGVVFSLGCFYAVATVFSYLGYKKKVQHLRPHVVPEDQHELLSPIHRDLPSGEKDDLAVDILDLNDNGILNADNDPVEADVRAAEWSHRGLTMWDESPRVKVEGWKRKVLYISRTAAMAIGGFAVGTMGGLIGTSWNDVYVLFFVIAMRFPVLKAVGTCSLLQMWSSIFLLFLVSSGYLGQGRLRCRSLREDRPRQRRLRR
eukprot:TRINITY_DN4606_c0_g1_i5.p1 TRINITY_DN4606_c0_g1~~TRINITY_DN4606_c0_g1_i5.p1  ORF type:complete len:315 (+),score=43.03 TRINITY_DN4606_c0_g1_i5:188-1132(+)